MKKKECTFSEEQIYERMATAYHDLLVRIGPLLSENKDVEQGLKEGLNKFLSNIYISVLGKKHTNYYSEKALEQINNNNWDNLVYEHMVPKTQYLQDECIQSAKNGNVKSKEEIKELLKKFWKIATITKEEDQRLVKQGLRLKMPEDWDGKDIMARYRKVNIIILSQKDI